MNVRLSRMIAIAALALPIALPIPNAAVAAEGSIRSRDFSVAPMGVGNGTSAPSTVESKRVVHSRQILEGAAHGGNGDTISGAPNQRKPVRRVTDFDFGQMGPDRAGLSDDTRMASRASDGGATQRH